MRNSKALIDALTIFFKNKIKFSLTLISTLGVIVAGLIYTVPTYEAKASILVKFGREYVYNNFAGDTKHPSNYFERENVINNELEILSSRELIEEVLTNYGVDRLYEDIYRQYPDQKSRVDMAAKAFSEDFSVKGVADSDLIRISFKHTDPQTSSSVLNIMTDLYKIKRLRTFRDQKTTALLAEKVESYQKSLKETEQKLQDFKQKHETYSFEDQINMLLQQKSDLDASRKDAKNRVSSYEALV